MPYSLEEVVKELDQMLLDQVVDSYAIGGAIAASFYGEVATTEDVDVFEDKVVIGGWPVQFLPPPSGLEEEAMERAVEMQDGDLKLRLFSREHVAAIALATGRAKDRNRLIQLREEGELDMREFEKIVLAHELSAAWAKFQDQFPMEPT